MNSIIRKIRDFKLPFFSSMQVFADLGTSMTRMAVYQKGIVLREPSYLGFNTRTHEFIFFGSEAKNIVGKTPEFLKIMRPIINGVISDFDAQVALTSSYIHKATDPYMQSYKLIKPTVEIYTVYPSIATEIEQKAIEEVFCKTGCSDIHMIKKPIATAAGCGINVFSHEPNLIVDLGGGLIEATIITGGGIVSQKTIKAAGEHMDKLIANYAYLKHGLILGETTCESLKINCLNFVGEDTVVTVRGKSLETGLPKSVKIRTGDIKEALLPNLNQIIDVIRELIEVAPPEVVDEIYERGIFITGGLSSIRGIASFFEEELKIKIVIPDHKVDATIYGLISLFNTHGDLHKLG